MRIPFLLPTIYFSFLGMAVTYVQSDTVGNGDPHPFLNKVQPFGYQSTSSQGNDFAASIVKSPREAQGYFMTGTTSGMLLHSDNKNGKSAFHVGMHCYVMQMKPFVRSWTWMKKYGAFRNKTPVPTTCTSVRALPVKDGDTDTKIMVTGYTEGDLLFNPDDGNLNFSEIVRTEALQNRINGFAILLSVPHSEEEKEEVDPQVIKVISGRMLHVEKVTYPISLTPVGTNDVVVVSMVTDETGVNLEAALKDASGEIGDFEPVFRYGQFYKVKAERLSYDPSSGLIRKLWSEIYSTDNGLGAQVTSVIHVELEDAVTVVGTTHGNGDAFGHTSVGDKAGTDLDGFIFTLDVNTGKLKQGMPPKRVETNPGKDEFISGMCKKKNGDAIYVVGSTNAIIDEDFKPAYDNVSDQKFNAFVRKINLNNMKPIWTRQIGPVNIRNDHIEDNHDVMGMGCTVNEIGSEVYVSGTVAAGSSVVPGQYPSGEQDIFVAGFHSTQGTPLKNFPTRQLGSVMDEYVAKDNGGLTTDQYGNAVLFGTTKGNFIGEKPPKVTQFQVPYADIYFMSFLVQDAEHVSTIEISTPDGINSSAVNAGTSNQNSSLKIAALSVLGICIIISVFTMAFKSGKRQATSQIEHQTDQDIARYLEEFEGGNVQNINSRGAATNSPVATSTADNQMYDISSYYGQNFAMGKEDPTESAMLGDTPNVPPNEVSLPGDSVENVADSSAETSTNTYDDLMESYKSIMAATATGDDSETNDHVIT